MAAMAPATMAMTTPGAAVCLAPLGVLEPAPLGAGEVTEALPGAEDDGTTGMVTEPLPPGTEMAVVDSEVGRVESVAEPDL